MTAAAARKLQKEIDNVLKKVDDGISEFAEYWEQATAAGSNQQKEKLGEELKRSINKLQRFRVQIREWLAQAGVQSDAKDKLEDARKRIENDMQRFKDFERELKTKAFSTCALARGDELELEEAEKMKYQDWLTQTIQSLNDQLDQFEADLELLANKKSLSSEDKARQSQLKALQERHRWHIQKMELVLRAVDNDALDLGDLAIVREGIDFYVDNNQDIECIHDEGIYDCFDLTEFEDKAPPPKSPSEGPKVAPGTPNSKEDPQKKAKEKEKRRKDEKKDKKREERDAKKSAGDGRLPQKATPGASPKGVVGKILDAKLCVIGAVTSVQVEVREPTETDEIKVQEEQLLSEAAEFICKICQIHVAGCGPKLTSCSHLFCGDCIATWFNQHPDNQTWAQRARSAGPDRVVPCPVCKQPLNEKRDLYPVCGVTSRSENLLLWRMLSSLKIVCANHQKVRPDGKCDWVGEYGSYQKHASQCKNQSMSDAETPAVQPTSVRTVSVDSDSECGSAPMSRDASVKSLVAATTLGQVPQSPLSVLPRPHSPAVDGAIAIAGTARDATISADDITVVAPVVAGLTPIAAKGITQQPSDEPVANGHTVQAAPPPMCSPATLGTPAPTESLVTPSAAPIATAVGPALATQAPKPASNASPGGATPAVHIGALAAALGNSAADSALAGQRMVAPDARARDSDGGFTVHAVSSFEPTGTNMVQVHAGDLIRVLEHHKSGWTYAKNLSLSPSSGCGWIPSWIVPQQLVEEARELAPPPKPEAKPVVRASSTFAATSPSQLTLTPADIVEIVERHPSGWTYGRKVSQARGEGAAEGWFPDWVVAEK